FALIATRFEPKVVANCPIFSAMAFGSILSKGKYSLTMDRPLITQGCWKMS
ncbi:putative dNA-binding protein HU, partial [Vibrio parahaemolyticus V-223/04]